MQALSLPKVLLKRPVLLLKSLPLKLRIPVREKVAARLLPRNVTLAAKKGAALRIRSPAKLRLAAAARMVAALRSKRFAFC